MRYILPFLGLTLLLASCGADKAQQEAAVGAARADSLYHDLHAVYLTYTDSIRALPDSDTVDRCAPMVMRFEQRLYKIYRSYPPDLDAALSPSQNDSLWQLTQAYLKARNQKSKPTAPDTIQQE